MQDITLYPNKGKISIGECVYANIEFILWCNNSPQYPNVIYDPQNDKEWDEEYSWHCQYTR